MSGVREHRPLHPQHGPKQLLFGTEQPFLSPEQRLFGPEQSFLRPTQPLLRPEQSFLRPIQPLLRPEQSFLRPIQPLCGPEKSFLSPIQPLYGALSGRASRLGLLKRGSAVIDRGDAAVGAAHAARGEDGAGYLSSYLLHEAQVRSGASETGFTLMDIAAQDKDKAERERSPGLDWPGLLSCRLREMKRAGASKSICLAVASVAVWLAAGLIITIGIAWTIAKTGQDPRPSSTNFTRVPGGHWSDVPPTSWPQVPDDVSIEQDWAGRTEHTDSARTSLYGDAPEDVMTVYRCGWPVRSLAWTRLGVQAMGGHTEIAPTSVWSGGIADLAGKGSAAPMTFALGLSADIRRLPIRPVWPGFALNTIFYALIAWGLWQVPLAIRRRRRRRKGFCVRCGYDLKGLTAGVPCPECGTQPGA